MKLDLRVPTNFPSFDEWPTKKVIFMVRRSFADRVEEDDMGYQSEEGENSVVVCTKAMSKENPMSECRYCKMRMTLTFSMELEEWVYSGTRQTKSGVVLHSLCYYFARRDRLFL